MDTSIPEARGDGAGPGEEPGAWIEIEGRGSRAARLVRTKALDGSQIGPGGVSLGCYEFREELGRGGMGVVWRAFDSNIRREIAVKTTRDDRAGAAEIARLVEEGQISGQLEHPHIPPVYEMARDCQGRVYISMRLIEGRTLSRRLKETAERIRGGAGDGSFPLGARLSVFLKVCDAVAYAHSRGVIHRDLKPQNVLLGEFGEVMVLDWGVARVLPEQGRPDSGLVVSDRADKGVDLTGPGMAVGTPGYVAPEQLLRVAGHLATGVDVYSLGAILYEILAFSSPFRGPDKKEVLRRVLSEDPERPSRRVRGDFPGVARRRGPASRAPRVPRALEAIAMKALARSPSDRIGSVLELRREVEEALAEGMTAARRGSLLEQALSLARRIRGRPR